uniref:Uncharacterized protein n=1 Tax=Arundo donax TaxID=35708 RepID=A0A0A8YYB6_ARUDO
MHYSYRNLNCRLLFKPGISGLLFLC